MVFKAAKQPTKVQSSYCPHQGCLRRFEERIQMESVTGGNKNVAGAHTSFVLCLQYRIHVSSCESLFED